MAMSSRTPAPPGTALRRAAATGTVALLVLSAFGAGVVVTEARGGGDPPLRLTAAGLDSGLSCDGLRAWYVDHGVAQVTAWGWQGPAYRMLAGTAPGSGMAEDAAGATPGTSLDAHPGSSTGTNVQEAGVDEPDIAKTTGDLLVRISGDTLKTDDVSGSEPRRLGVAALDRMGDPRLLLSGDRAVVIGAEVGDPTAGASLLAPPPRTWVRTYDLADPRAPTLVSSREYDGSLVSARQVGPVVRLVLDGGLPQLDFVQPSESVSAERALTHNQGVVRSSTVDDWLPHVTSYDTATHGPYRSPVSTPLVDCSDVAVPETFNGLGTLTVVGLDPAEPTTTDTTAVATASEAAYLSPSHLYVATSTWSGAGLTPLSMPMPTPMPMPVPVPMPADASQPTRLYGFDLSGTSATYVGMGTVSGSVAGSWSMDEHDGVLRVAASSPSGSTSVVMLRPESGRLLDVGHLDGLGEGQQLKSVRWFDDLAVLVTFRQTDPFYVLDVGDPADPRLLGTLHLPGWSSYLQPVGPRLVLGLGQTAPQDVITPPPLPTVPPVPVPEPPQPKATDQLLPEAGQGVATASPGPTEAPDRPPVRISTQRAKATLFDLGDLAHPRVAGTVTYPQDSVSMAGTDPHLVTWLPERHILLTVIASGPGSATYAGSRRWISVLTVRAGSVSNRLVPVAAGVIEEVRTVPLADGRVVLVTGDSVRFLTL
jgi:hypothetical protein